MYKRGKNMEEKLDLKKLSNEALLELYDEIEEYIEYINKKKQ